MFFLLCCDHHDHRRALGLDLLLELAQRATPTGNPNHMNTDPQAHEHVWCAAVLMVFVAVRAYLGF
jgi:hypothetical protein